MYKKMKLKGVISSLLAACLTAGLFAGCNTAPAEPAGTAEVTQEDTASTEKPAGADADSLEAAAEADTDSAEKKTEGDTDVIPELTRGDADGFLHVTYDPSGQYSVSFGAGDLITSQTAAGRMDEEMDRALDAEEMTGEPADITDDGDGPADAAEEPAEGAEVSVPGEAADDGPSEDSDAADTEEAEEAEEAAEELSEEASEEPSPEETAEPAQEAAAEEKTEEEISETAPVTEEETVSDEESAAEEAEVSAETDFSGIRQEDLEISYVIQEQGSQDIQQKNADITGFKNEDGIIELIFTDPDAAEYKTQGYLITALGGQTGTMIEVDFEDHSVTADISEISAASDSTEVTLSLAEGSFSDDIKPEDITLGQSFKEMSVDSVKANGGYLTLALSGSPVLEPEVASVYTAGEITLASDAVVNGRSDLSAYIDVQAPMVGLDQSGIEENGDTVTFPMTLTGMEAEDISASDVSFDGAGTVTDVSADGDRLLVTVKADDGNTADLYGDLTVGDAGMVVGVSHASVNAVFDYIEMDGDDLLITLNMFAVSGSIAEDISEKSFSLDMDFEGGSIESTDRTDEDHAEVVIRFPANGMTDEDYSVLGAFTLAEGALIDEDGSPAPEFTCARQYIPEEMGRDRTPMDMINDYISFGKEAYKYGKPVYDVASSIASGNYVGAVTGAISFFSAIFGDDDSGPDVGKELQEIKAEIAKIHNKLDEIDQAVGRIADQTDQNRLADFETNVGMVESYAGILEKMLANAKEELKKQGIMEPQNDEEAEDYYDKLIRYCEDMQKSDTRFKAFDNSINKLREYYLKVAIESAKKDAASPFYAYEDYYMQHYNFSTQSYYLRCCYMANVDLQLKRAYNILAIYHNIAAYPDENKDISQRFAGAVNTIESRDLGSSPLDVPSGNAKIYSSTFKKTFTGGHVGGYLDYDKDDIANCWDKYTSKLYGSSVKEDLLLAGFDLKNAEGFGLKKTKGPVCEVVKVSKFVIRPILASYYTDYILFDGGTKKNTRTYRDETVTSLFFLLDDSMKNLARG